jgi:pseudouridine-5'-phosphate glycosidase
MMKYISYSEEVKYAIKHQLPIVALESTIISHGMPYPKNVETAKKAEEIVRSQGAVPATIAIIQGVCKVGLSAEEIEYIGKKGLEVIKTSRRDISYIVSQNLDGATTVSATMFIASLAGIKVFATGGIGGVHRKAETTFDISADLEELAQTDVAVICAGAKSILDLGLTLEYLETKGVPVIGYQTIQLPAFYTRESDFKVNYQMDSPTQIANMIHCKWSMGLTGGIVIANPIPDQYSLDKRKIDAIIHSAVSEMEQLNIKGKDTTPFLLSKIEKLTEGVSLESNIALVYNNCKLASEIAVAFYKINKNERI